MAVLDPNIGANPIVPVPVPTNPVNYVKRFWCGCAVAVIVTPLKVAIPFLPILVPAVIKLVFIVVKAQPYSCIIGPIIEEIAFRFLLQDILLKRVPKYIIKKILPGKETVVDNRITKVFRILFTATLFAASHTDYTFFYKTHVFIVGITSGVLKESKMGILGAIGYHITNNSLVNIFSIVLTIWATPPLKA